MPSPNLSTELAKITRILTHTLIISRVFFATRGGESEKLRTRVDSSQLMGRFAAIIGNHILDSTDSQVLINWFDAPASLNVVEENLTTMFSKECLPAWWIEITQLIRRTKRFLNHSDNHLRTIQELQHWRSDEKNSAKSSDLIDRLLALFDDSRASRTITDPVCNKWEENLSHLLESAGSRWPVNLLLQLSSLNGTGDWFDKLSPKPNEFVSESQASPSIALADWLVTHLPDRDIHPTGTLCEIFDTLSNGRIRLWRTEMLTIATKGWLTEEPPGERLYRNSGWLFTSQSAVSLETPVNDKSKIKTITDAPTIPAETATIAIEHKPDFPEDAPLMLRTLAQEFRQCHTSNDRRKIIEQMLHELIALKSDPLLDAIRRLAAVENWTLLPESWSFQKFPHWDAPPTDVILDKKFSEDYPKATITGIRVFGIRGVNESPVSRPARVEVSLGKAPLGYVEIITLMQTRRSDEPGYQAIRERVGNWVSHIWDGRFEEEIRRFYVDFHGNLGDAWRRENPAAVDEFRSALVDMLRRQFSYTLFEPRTRDRNNTDWMILVGNNAPRTNQVRRVVQPGLFDARQRLIVPARVEME